MERMTIAVLCSPCGVTWHRDKAPVNLVLGLVIPNAHQPDIEDVKAVTCLTRNLLNPVYTQRLLTTKRWTDLQWLLTCGLRQLLPL